MESQETTTTSVGLSTETPGGISKPSPADKRFQEWIAIGTDFLTKMYDYIGEFISENQKLLINLLLLLAAVVAVNITLAVLGAINNFPLLSPLFELIGLGYTIWFVSRYMRTKSDRMELKNEFQALKSQIIGGDESIN